MKRKPKTKRMTFEQFRRRALHAYAVHWGYADWDEYARVYSLNKICPPGRVGLNAGWRRAL